MKDNYTCTCRVIQEMGIYGETVPTKKGKCYEDTRGYMIQNMVIVKDCLLGKSLPLNAKRCDNS